MALDPISLESELRDMFADAADDAAAAAQQMADLYEAYALDGMFGASTVSVLPVNKAALVAALVTGLAPAPAGVAFATAWSNGLLAFWAANPVAGAQAGVTVPPTGAAAMLATLTAAFAAPQSASSAAAALATALDTATKTTTASVAPPPGTVLPIL